MIESHFLKDSGLSLTKHLSTLAGEPVYAKVLWQGFVNKLMPGSKGPQSYWLRQVCLVSAGVPHVLANVYVPHACLLRMPWITRLGPKPLGKVLFHHYRPQRAVLASQFATLKEYQFNLSLLGLQRFKQLLKQLHVEPNFFEEGQCLNYIFTGMQLGLNLSPGAFDLYLEEYILDKPLRDQLLKNQSLKNQSLKEALN